MDAPIWSPQFTIISDKTLINSQTKSNRENRERREKLKYLYNAKNGA